MMKYYSTILQRTTTDTCNNVAESPRDDVEGKKVYAYILQGSIYMKFTNEQNQPLVIKIRRIVGER